MRSVFFSLHNAPHGLVYCLFKQVMKMIMKLKKKIEATTRDHLFLIYSHAHVVVPKVASQAWCDVLGFLLFFDWAVLVIGRLQSLFLKKDYIIEQ